MSLSRLQSYVDAILAIAATLLILNVTVTGGGSLSHSLVHAWPSYAAYAVSFLTIGVIWINHHAILRLIEEPDPLFVIQNLMLLLFVAFLPFPTHVLAEPKPKERHQHKQRSQGESEPAAFGLVGGGHGCELILQFGKAF